MYNHFDLELNFQFIYLKWHDFYFKIPCLGIILYVERFEIQILKSLAGIYTWIWINRMFSFFNPFACDLIEQVRVMVSSFNHYDPTHLTIKRWVLGLKSDAFMDLFFKISCAFRVYILINH